MKGLLYVLLFKFLKNKFIDQYFHVNQIKVYCNSHNIFMSDIWFRKLSKHSLYPNIT